jgi:hypothetical protein
MCMIVCFKYVKIPFGLFQVREKWITQLFYNVLRKQLRFFFYDYLHQLRINE